MSLSRPGTTARCDAWRRGWRMALPFVAPTLVLAAWWWVTATGRVPLQTLQPPAEVFITARTMLIDGELLDAAAQTLRRIAGGFVLGSLIGIAAGALLGGHRLLDRYAGPLLYALMHIPGLVWVPALIAAFGIGEGFKFAGIALAVFFPVASSVYEAVRGIPVRYLELGAVLKLPPLTRTRRILLPAVWPRLVAGLRIGASKAWLVVVFVELFAASSGLGYLMDSGRTMFQMDVVLTAVVVAGVLGYAMDCALLFAGSRAGRGGLQS